MAHCPECKTPTLIVLLAHGYRCSQCDAPLHLSGPSILLWAVTILATVVGVHYLFGDIPTLLVALLLPKPAFLWMVKLELGGGIPSIRP